MRRLILSILTFMLAVLGITAATSAWVSLATVNYIDHISLTATKGNGLELSVDNITYYESIPSSVMMEQIKGLSLGDMTSTDGKTFHYGLRNKPNEPKPNKDYMALEFYIRTTDPRAHYVFLSNNISNEITYDQTKTGTYIVSKGNVWESPVDFLYDEQTNMSAGDRQTFYLSHAMRISIIEEKILEHDTRLESELNSKLFDLSEDSKRGYGQSYGALAYYNKVRGSNILPPKDTPKTVYKLSTFDEHSPFAKDDASLVAKLLKSNQTNIDGKPYYVGKIKLNIWIEGWDADAFDSVYADQVRIQFEFKAVYGIRTN